MTDAAETMREAFNEILDLRAQLTWEQWTKLIEPIIEAVLSERE